MLSSCGKAVLSQLKTSRKDGECLSPKSTATATFTTFRGAKAVVVRVLVRNYPHSFAHRNFAILPLVEHYFYPLSTPPIIIYSKGKKV